MAGVNLFDLALHHTHWFGNVQRTIATNIANANTPGFLALSSESFLEALARQDADLATLASGDGPSRLTSTAALRPRRETTLSGNSVEIDQQLIAAGEAAEAWSMNVGAVKSFHRMFLASAKG